MAYFFFHYFLINVIFESVLVPCKFNVLSLKMMRISNHSQFLCFYDFLDNKL
jgi:hypothetical protein